jgi:hypothetical protein
MNTIEKAKDVATWAHSGQFRLGGMPYITHPEAVANMLMNAGESEEVVATAWLHDVVEDTQVTLEDLRAHGFPESVVMAVEVITKVKGEWYYDYLDRVLSNVIATKVKTVDMMHNLGGLFGSGIDESLRKKNIAKYANGLAYMTKPHDGVSCPRDDVFDDYSGPDRHENS